MTYALLLLGAVAVLTMSVWSDMPLPVVDETGIRAAIRSSYERARDRATNAVKERAREELHELVDDKLQ